ncbi:MAG: glycoside hydrolase family 2 protein [Lachnospiraceae bacterium]|nr:glycoside hydrolase family 2 protein [Lachnospiraceae bacterium]
MRKIVNLNENWFFCKNQEEIIKEIPMEATAVDLPHTWNGIDGQDGGSDYFRGTCSYSKELLKEDLPVARKYFLEINGANSSADVYINGNHRARHDGGYSTFRVDITEALQERNILTALVDNAPSQFVYPQFADFTFYGGLYRDVNLIAVEDTHFDLSYYGGKGLQITPAVEGTCAKVTVKAYVTGLQTGDTLCYRLADAQGGIVAEMESEKEEETFILEGVHLWDGVNDPYLYTASVSVKRNGTVLDEVSERFGCRSFSIDPERGFILNGREYPLRGVSRHQDRPGIGNALLFEHHREDMELICEMGANTIRLAHYQHDRYFYDLCDEKGMVVWAEIPYISRHMTGANENAVSQMKELIVQNYNHPSIVVWGLSNEITLGGAKNPDLLANHERLNDLVHEMDPTRLTTIACISHCKTDEEIVHLSDVVAYNHYFGWYGGDVQDNGVWFDKFHKKYPQRAIGCSEYGCEALNWHSSNPMQGDYTEEYQAYYHEELIKQLFSRRYIWATYVWNMFDFGADSRAEGGENGQNHKGLVTIDRKYKKDSFYAYKAWLSKEPFVHICGKRYVDRVEEITKVTVYSNLPEVELFANGESLGKKQAEEHFFYFDVPNRGETQLLAVAGECKDESLIKKVDSVNPDYILKEQGTVLNWFDITAPKGRYSLNDTIGDMLKSVRGKLFVGGLLLRLLKTFKKNDAKGAGGDEAKNKTEMPEINSGMIKMVSSFTLLRLTGMLGMVNVSFTKEELLAMNRKLNKIKKPKGLSEK